MELNTRSFGKEGKMKNILFEKLTIEEKETIKGGDCSGADSGSSCESNPSPGSCNEKPTGGLCSDPNGTRECIPQQDESCGPVPKARSCY